MLALRIAATGMAAQDLNVQVISNNIANMNTVGYKRQVAEFEDLLYQNIQQEGTQSSDTGTIVPTGIQVGAGVKAGQVERVNTQGAMTQTGNQLDMAINGAGYFQVLTAVRRDRLHPGRQLLRQRHGPDRHPGRLSGAADHGGPARTPRT